MNETPDNRVGPSDEVPADVEFLDTDLTEFVYDEPLDLGTHGEVDPQKPSGVLDDPTA